MRTLELESVKRWFKVADLLPFLTISTVPSQELSAKAATDALKLRSFLSSPPYAFNILYAIEGSVPFAMRVLGVDSRDSNIA